MVIHGVNVCVFSFCDNKKPWVRCCDDQVTGVYCVAWSGQVNDVIMMSPNSVQTSNMYNSGTAAPINLGFSPLESVQFLLQGVKFSF